MNKQINLRVDEALWRKIQEKGTEFGVSGVSETIRRLMLLAFHLTDDMEENEKLLLAIKVINPGKPDATN